MNIHNETRGNSMYIAQLKFSANKAQAPELMTSHNEWIQRGFDEKVFLMVGSIQPNLGGAIMAHNCSLKEFEQRVSEDPFVQADVVTAEIIEITAAKTEPRLDFLLE